MNDSTSSTEKVLTLTHNQQIRVAGFRFNKEITVFSISGYAIASGEAPEDAIARSVKFGHNLNPTTIQAASILTADYNGKAEALAKEAQAFAASPIVEKGQIVEIDGKLFTVRIAGEGYSDPVHFVPVL
jgi:hypothetical protein